MRPLIFSVFSVLFWSCASEDGVKTYNDNPEATITSHSDGFQTVEGQSLEFRAQVSDSNHQIELLQVAWFLGETAICDWQSPGAAGESSCEMTPSAEDSVVIVEVRDPEGAGGRDEISIEVIPSEPPTVEILSPVEGEVYHSDGLIRFTAQVEDAEDAPDLLQTVWSSSLQGELNLDAAPDSLGFVEAFTQLEEGEHAIQVEVVDSEGKTSTDSVIVEVLPPNQSPLCSISSPADGSFSAPGETVFFEGSASDPDSPADELSVEWESDRDGSLGSATVNSQGEISFPFTDLSSANHVISMKISDPFGATCTDTLIVIVGNSPEINISSPAPADIFQQAESIHFMATVTDSEDSPDQLQISWNSSIDGEIDNQSPASDGAIEFSRSDLSPGEHSLTVSAVDSDGMSTSVQIDFQINIPPEVMSIEIDPSPAYNDDTLNCNVQYTDPENEPVSVSHVWTNLSTGAVLGTGQTQNLDSSVAASGDEVRCDVTLTDASGGVTEAGLTDIIDNRDPLSPTVVLSPDPAFVMDSIHCAASATDPDGDPISYQYTWIVSGAFQSESSDTLGSGFVKGDMVTCRVTALDGKGGNTSGLSAIEISNSPPTIPASVDVSPLNPSAGQEDLVCLASGSTDNDSVDTVSYVYSWTVDGNPYTGVTNNGGTVVPGSVTVAGEHWVCMAYATDGFDDSPNLSSSGTIVSGGCPGGTADIYSQSDLQDYINCTELDGVSLHITSGVFDVDLPNLQTVTGNVYFHQNNDVSNVSFPALSSVGGHIYFHGNQTIANVDLSSLQTVGTYLYFHGNTDLESIDLGAIQSVGGYFYFTGNSVLEMLTVNPGFSHVGEYVYFSGNPNLCVPDLDWETIAVDYVYEGGNASCP